MDICQFGKRQMPDTKMLNAMDTLEKLSKKNKDHPKHQSNERFLLSIMMLVLIPFIFGIAIDSEVIYSSVSFNL